MGGLPLIFYGGKDFDYVQLKSNSLRCGKFRILENNRFFSISDLDQCLYGIISSSRVVKGVEKAV